MRGIGEDCALEVRNVCLWGAGGGEDMLEM